jgi:ribosomal protein L12E/L44/L45/RPP1/RPP2
MSKELPFFKFTATEWLTGDISYEPFEIQGLYIAICATYWAKNGSVTLAKLKQRLSSAQAEHWECLIAGKYIEIVNGRIVIKFLDEQIDELSSIRDKKVAAGRLGAAARVFKHRSSTAQAPLKHKDKEEDKEEDKDEESGITRESIFSFFLTSKVDKQLKANRLKSESDKFYNYYGSQNWRKANGQKITNMQLAVDHWLSNLNEKHEKQAESIVTYVPPREVAAAMEKLANQKSVNK